MSQNAVRKARVTERCIAAAAFGQSERPTMGTRLVFLHSREAIVAACEDIEDLCQDLCEANVFYEPWFLFPALEHLAPHRGMHFLCLYEQGGQQRLCGFLPLIESRLHPRLPLWAYEAWAHSQCFRCTPLVRRGFAEEFWDSVVSWLENQPWHRRLLHLQRLPADGELWDCLQSALQRRPSLRTLLYRFDSAILRTGSSYDATLDRAMSKSTRRKLEQQRRRLARNASLEFTDVDDGPPIDAVIEEFLEIEASGWKGRAGTALASSRQETAFFRDIIRAAYDLGRLSFLSLRLDGRMIAAQCVFQAAPGSFQFKAGYRESYAKYSPGILLECEEMRRMLEPGDRPRAGLAWADSCAGPYDGPNYRCWPERRPIARYRITTTRTLHALLIALWPLVRRIVRLLPGTEKARHAR